MRLLILPNAHADQQSHQQKDNDAPAVHGRIILTTMRPQPAPEVPGATEAERMDHAVRRIFSTPKPEAAKAEKKAQPPRAPKKKAA